MNEVITSALILALGFSLLLLTLNALTEDYFLIQWKSTRSLLDKIACDLDEAIYLVIGGGREELTLFLPKNLEIGVQKNNSQYILVFCLGGTSVNRCYPFKVKFETLKVPEDGYYRVSLKGDSEHVEIEVS